MKLTTQGFLRSNRQHTYGYAVGYVSGRSAAELKRRFAGLGISEWRQATDDYAHGYREGFRDGTEGP